jgi:hypothetical protein
MNWLISSADPLPSWQRPCQDWGLGKCFIGDRLLSWDTPSRLSMRGTSSTVVYTVGPMKILVNRKREGSFFTETYSFINGSNHPLSLQRCSIYAPFNDNYPDADTCATLRCHAHIWPGMDASYVNAVRMGGEGPHLGLVLIRGALQNYSIENRGWDGGNDYSSSNVRGTLLLNLPVINLPAAGRHTLQWKLFWHKGWADFFSIARSLGFVQVSAPHYVLATGDTLHVTVTGRQGQKHLHIPVSALGEHQLSIPCGRGQYTILNYAVVSSPQQLIDQRVHFIVDHQQMNDNRDPRYGAYMIYDNENKTIPLDLSHSISPEDHDEGAERLGMGVLIAKWLQTHRDTSIYQSFMRYAHFVRHGLQTPDHKVYSSVTRAGRHRGYNYPWVADLYLQAYKLTREPRFIVDYFQTIRRFYKEFGHGFYAIGIPLKEGMDQLSSAGMTSQRDTLLEDFTKMGDLFLKNGIYYPKHEVNYEQSIVAPAVCFLCELYLVTHNIKYLNGAKEQMPSLAAFSGRQPDAHLNDIAMRHWDGYWFGKRECFGDVMPHYWSAINAVAFQRYYECTRDRCSRERALRIVENNLLNFREDGSASCAYLYPASIDGKPGKYYDPYANDQDWALCFYLFVKNGA